MSPKNMQPITQPLLIGIDKVIEKVSISRSNIYDLMNAGRFLEPIKLGKRVLWNYNELEEWINQKCPSMAQWRNREGAK